MKALLDLKSGLVHSLADGICALRGVFVQRGAHHIAVVIGPNQKIRILPIGFGQIIVGTAVAAGLGSDGIGGLSSRPVRGRTSDGTDYSQQR